MIKIDVLMSTYNGEKYLAQQIDSILAQKGGFSLKLHVRDDGSTDGTCNILKKYSEKQGVNVVYGKNIGVNASMMELIKNSSENSDYFAFSDQDDLWYDFRLNEAISALEAAKTDKPLLWSCMEELTDENLTPYNFMPMPKYLGNFYNAIIQNKTAGHTQVFNKSLRNLYKDYPPKKMYVYDWVLYIMASAFGKVLFCEKTCGKYRQHGTNSIGYETGWLKQLPRRAKRLLRGDFKHITAQLEYFYETYKDKLNLEHRRELDRMLNSRKNILKRIYYALTTKIKRNTKFESAQFRLLYILGVFK